MNSIQNKIIQQIQKNRISTCEISDALDKKGVLSDVYALNSGHFISGPIRYIYAYNKSNWEMHQQLEKVESGEVIIIDAINCENYAVLGALVSKFCLLYKQVSALVILGLVRDINILKKENYSIWCKGTTPLGCYNIKNKELPTETELNERKRPFNNAIAVCDDSGVTVIPDEKINREFMTSLELIELQEDAWFHSIDTDKYTTYETVCLKRYLDKDNVFHRYSTLKNNTLE